MQTIAVIGYGAIARFVVRAAGQGGFKIAAIVARAGRENAARDIVGGLPVVSGADALPSDLDAVVDCAGHAGLQQHGPRVLAAGLPLISVSAGALADRELQSELRSAAVQGGAKLFLASGAIGALDALSAASAGDLRSVTYSGRKPPAGWRGSAAEEVLDLDHLSGPATHFSGSARDCALAYPKNANVAAAVGLAGIGLDDTQAELIADPGLSRNVHEIRAIGDFGEFTFSIAGQGLPENPKSSALTAMSVVRAILNRDAAIRTA